MIANTITTVLNPPQDLKESDNPIGDFIVSTGKSFTEGFVGGVTGGMISKDPSSVIGGTLAATFTHAMLNGGINAPPKDVAEDGIGNSISFAFPIPSTAGKGIAAVAVREGYCCSCCIGHRWVSRSKGYELAKPCHRRRRA